MKKLLLTLLSFYFVINSFSQNIGYFNYGQSGKASWSNHVVINSAGELVMAGYVDSKPCIVVANVAGAYVTNRVVASSGELFSATIDAADNIYGGGYYGSLGAEKKYIVKYNSAMTQLYTKNYGAGNIRYLINDGTDVVAAGFNSKPCVLKTDASGNIIWYKEYTINGKNADAYMIHKSGSSYYVTGSFDEGGNAKSYVLSVDVTTGNVNWCSTYVGAAFSPHFTGMAVSATGIILCGATASSNSGNPGNLIVVKIDFSGNVIWTRQINGQYSWYMRDPTNSGNAWGISCAIDPYGDLVVAGETENNYSMLAKMKENTGTVMWTKRYGNGGGAGASDDGFHGITISGCTYLASGWMGPSIGSGWDFGLVVCDTSGYAGSSAACGTAITKVNSSPAITVATSTVTSVNLTTAADYTGQNVTANFSRVAVCASAVSYSISATSNTLCSGGTTTISVTAGALSYSWAASNAGTINGSNTSPSIIVNPSTTTSYTCFVGGASGCLAMLTITIPASTAGGGPTVAVTNATISCTNTTATLTATGGGTYNWSGSGIVSGSNTASPVVNQSGTYTVSVTSGGCSTTTTAIVTSIGSASLSVTSQTNINCFGANTGAAIVAGSGGTGPYTYTWVPGNLNGATQTSLTQGTYTINVRDAGGCIGTNTLTITQPTSAVSGSISTTPSGCGTSVGSATVLANGGTPGYTYSWSPSSGTGTSVSGLGSGNHSVLITDNKGCTVTVLTNIASANGPTLSITSQTNINCFGANTGAAIVSAAGGTSPYTYTWMPGNLNGTNQTSLTQGTYTISVSDDSGCIGTNNLTITQPTSSLSAAVTTTLASCGLSNGIASVTASGGTPGYTYNWLPSGGTSTSASSLAGGSYSVTVTDIKGCTVTAVANITSTSGPTLAIASQTNINCFGASTGAAIVSTNGGTSPYTYTWTPGNLNGATQTSLTQGTYTINVRDATGCVKTNTLTITQPTSALTGSITNTPSGCGNSVGSATVLANGGTPGYTYNWSPASGTGSSISGLAVGNYSVLITDSKDCTVTVNTSINSSGTSPTLSIGSQTNAGCGTSANGAVSINAAGTGPYTYTWSPSGGNSSTATGLASGNYTVFVSDAALCSSTITVTVIQSPPIVLTLTSTPASCENNDGTASVSTSGGTAPITIQWNTNSNNSSITGLSAASYSVLATDAAGCTSTGSINIITVGTLTVDVGIDATIFEGQSTPLNAQIPAGATIVWSPSTGLSCTNCPNPIASPTVTTNYCALTTIGTCTNTSCVTVNVKIDCSSNSDYSTPNAFTPNDDGINDEFCLKGWKKCINAFYIAIYNRWGEKVYESDDADFCWDGKFRGMTLNSGVFVFYIKATLENDSKISRKGNINLIR